MYFRFVKMLRKLLFPFSIVYDGVTRVRNYLYDIGIWESRMYNIPIICVGNLSVGGTGKSPMIELLVAVLQEEYKVAVLSRGYGRSSKGFLEVQINSRSQEVGDEPLQIKQNYPETLVVVCEDRRIGIEKIKNKVDVILMDDAFQHRKVTPSFTIMLSTFNELFYGDLVLPAGNLRESGKGYKRADVIVITKVPAHVAYAKQQEIEHMIQLLPEQQLYFSSIGYEANICSNTESLPLSYLNDKSFCLVTGIAKPEPLVSYLKRAGLNFTHKKYKDHHNFTKADLIALRKEELIVTTQKDYVRLQPQLDKYALFYLPIKTKMLNDVFPFFKKRILSAVADFKTDHFM